MKTYDFDDSPVMRELERLEIAKNGIPECKIEKKASTDESDSLICKLSSLSKSLRKIGKYNEADNLDTKIVKYVTAENTHLYRAHDEDGEDLIDFAHSDGAVKVHDSKEGYGVVETQITQHKKIVDMLNKQPTGKYASNSFLNEIASILKIANDSDIEQAKEFLKKGKAYLKQNLRELNHALPFIKFSLVEAVGPRWVTPVYYIYFTTKSGTNDVATVKNDKFPEIEKKKYWALFASYNKDANNAAEQWKMLLDIKQDGKEFWRREVEKANKNLKYSIESIIKAAETIGTVDAPNEPDKFILFANEQKRLFTILESSKWLIEQGINFDEDQIGRYNEGIDALKEGINKLMPLKKQYENKYLELINSISKDIASEIHRIGIDSNLFDNPSADYESLKKKFKFSNPEEFLNKLKVILPALKNAQSVKSGSIKYNFTKSADAADDLLKAIERLPKKQETVQAPASTPSVTPTTPSASVSTKPAVSNKTRRDYVNEWKSKVDKEYVDAVDNMQSFLVNTLYSNANAIFISILDKPGVAGLINDLKETAAKDYRGDLDIDAQWGPGTSKAVEAAKKLLSMLPNNSGFENIKSGEDVNVNGKTGYLYYAGYDIDKQKEVAKIASENVKVMNDVLSKNNLGMFSSSQNKEESINSVLDLIPKDSNMWGDPSFLSLGIDNPMPTDIPSAPITKQDLSNLVNFDRWLKAHDIVSGSGMGALFSDGGLNYHAFKVYIYRIKTRAEAMVRNASEATKAKAQEYFSDVSSLFTRLDDAWDAYKESNPDANDNKAVSPRALEMALLGGSPGVGSQTRPSQQGGSGSNGEGREGSEGFDSTVNRRSRQDEIQIPIGYSIQPMYLQKYYFGIFKNANELAPIIDIQTVKNIYSDPYGAYESIVGNANVPWSKMLSDLRYNPSDNAVSANGGVALKDMKGNTIKYINLSQTSATRVRIESEWKLKKLIEYLDSIQNSLIKINKEYYSRIMRLMPGKEGLERATANNEAVIDWNQAIEYAITSIRREINNLRTGKAKGFQI
jgi:hypothetical protein